VSATITHHEATNLSTVHFALMKSGHKMPCGGPAIAASTTVLNRRWTWQARKTRSLNAITARTVPLDSNLACMRRADKVGSPETFAIRY
jgi:hypothetical protein